jgi:hypothetical protein
VEAVEAVRNRGEGEGRVEGKEREGRRREDAY